MSNNIISESQWISLVKDINLITQELIEARKKLIEAKDDVISKKEWLANQTCDLICGGVPGKNEKERDAWIRRQTQTCRIALEKSERQERVASLELEIAKDKRQCLEDLIKIAGMEF